MSKNKKHSSGSLASGGFEGFAMTYSAGLSGLGLARGSRSTHTPSEVWILSSALVQPAGTRGHWDDAETWVDTNIWYD